VLFRSGRLGDGHYRHHAGLNGVAYHEIRGVWHAPRHIQADHQQPSLPHFADCSFDITPHQGSRQHEGSRTRQSRHRAHGISKLLLADQRNGVD